MCTVNPDLNIFGTDTWLIISDHVQLSRSRDTAFLDPYAADYTVIKFH